MDRLSSIFGTVAYLLDLLCPGFGHLSVKRWVVGPLLLWLWIAGEVFLALAVSVNVWNLAAMGAFHVVLGGLGCLRLWRLRRRDRIERTGTWAAVALLVVVPLLVGGLFLGVTRTLVRPMVIRSGSMMPSIRTGDVVLAQLFGPVVFGVARGDIVLVAHPTERGRLLVKRVLGLVGDLIESRGGVMYRNGRPLAQCRLRTLRDPENDARVIERLEVQPYRPYFWSAEVNRSYLVWDEPEVISTSIRTRVEPGRIFVIGDNRDRSGDSRTFGTVPLSSVRALIRVRLYPLATNELDRAPLGARKAAYRRCQPSRGQL